MKVRFAWLGDAEDEDSYSAREARILLRAIARNPDIIPLWFAVGSSEPPHIWNGIRVFPVPNATMSSPDFLRTLIKQQRPQVVLSNLPAASLSGIIKGLNRKNMRWIHRVHPEDLQEVQKVLVEDGIIPPDMEDAGHGSGESVPYIAGLDPSVHDGADATTVLNALNNAIAGMAAQITEKTPVQTHLVMRQQLFSNSSLSQAMFELTAALLEAGCPTIPQDEHGIFAGGIFHREEEFYRAGAAAKYERICQNLRKQYDPENAITIHFGLLKSAQECTRCGTFPSLAGREVLYVTGNHTVSEDKVRELKDNFEMVLAPSEHVLRPYIEAGLERKAGAVIPHGINPSIYSPEMIPFPYPTKKRFKFLQTSFPWVHEKGFDLTLKAYCRAFSSRDDVALILRVPRIRQPDARKRYYGQLETLVKEALRQPGGPEILLLESDVKLNWRGRIYTGADCYVHPLRAEGFGMTILEAMACGLPVIATPWSGPADFLSEQWAYTLQHSDPVPDQGENGAIESYHVEPDLDHLISRMRYAFEHGDEGKALGKKAADVAARLWTWDQAAGKLASLFFETRQNEASKETEYFPITLNEKAGRDPQQHLPVQLNGEQKTDNGGQNGKAANSPIIEKLKPEGNKIIFTHFLSPGDVVMLTAAVRDLHKCYPKKFVTAVHTPFPHLWENNPYVTPLDEKDPEVMTLHCEYPLINRSNQTPVHFIHAFIEFLNEKLGLQIRPTEFRGDIHVSNQEKSWFSQVHEILGQDVPFWIIVAGGKTDFTIKWWDHQRFQEVVDHFHGKILFVQIGDKGHGHRHQPLKGVIDLRGKTDIRQLVRLMYHAQGVLCPVTFAMHLAAAVEVRENRQKNRPCVVVAGGREPFQWEAYPHHQYIHTNGALWCCSDGGCWKCRTVPLGDGDLKDKPENLCSDVVGSLPRCMDMITADEVIRRINLYFTGGVIRYLSEEQRSLVESALTKIANGN